ncbi:MAG TPA: GEVED domain-containing protein, partial [Perlabentimonas sp.]|nr:GEVED domain-containing protein [Perlabentimonas sp.]
TVLLGTAIVEGGSATISFSEPITTALDLTITATAYNKVTYTGQLSAVPADEPYVVLKSFQTPTSPNYGETISLDVVLENISDEPYTASSVVATILTENPYVTITGGSVDAGPINPDQEVTLDGAFSFSIANDVPDQTPMVFTISIEGVYEGETYEWQQNFTIKANAPAFEYGALAIDDSESGDGNGILDPGETAMVSVVLTNVGHADASDIAAALISGSTDVTVGDSPLSVATLAAGAEVSLQYAATAKGSTPLGTSVTLTATATTGDHSTENEYEVIVGFVPEYCVSGATSSGWGDLTGFTFGPLENMTELGGTYDDFTDVPELVHEFVVGETYDVSVTLDDANNTSYTKGAKVFIDWNYNGEFTDDGETAFTVTPQNANWTAEGTITIPEDAPLGQKFVRVVVRETTNLDDIQPCGTFSWGGTEDYRIILVSSTRQVHFVVVDPNAEPIEGAEVSLTGYEAQTTDAQGLATFAEVEPAQGLIYAVTHNDFKMVKGTVNVNEIDVTVNVTLDPITGAPVNLSQGVQVYPNPFSSQLTLEGVSHVHQVEVINLLGQRMMLKQNNGSQTMSLPTNDLETGVYLVRLTDLQGTQTIVKVVKE